MAGTPVTSIVKGVYSSTAMRVQYTGVAGDSNASLAIVSPYTAIGTFAPGDNDAASFWVKGAATGSSTVLQNLIMSSDNTVLAGAWLPFTLTGSWTRQIGTDISLPASTSRAATRILVEGIDTGDTVDITIDAVQLEKGAFATSYIPTTTTTVARNADVVTVPTTEWSASSGSVLAVAGDAANRTSTINGSCPWVWYGTGGSIRGSDYYSNYYTYDYVAPTTYYDQKPLSAGYHTRASTWSNGNIIRAYVDSSPGTRTDVHTQIPMNNTAYLGSQAGTSVFDGPIQRLAIYSSALSGSDITTVTNAIKDGP